MGTVNLGAIFPPRKSAFNSEDRLGDGVLFDVEGQSGDPLGEAAESEAGEGPVEGLEQCLPDRPEERSVSHRGISEWCRMGSRPPGRFRSADALLNGVQGFSWSGGVQGNQCLEARTSTGGKPIG